MDLFCTESSPPSPNNDVDGNQFYYQTSGQVLFESLDDESSDCSLASQKFSAQDPQTQLINIDHEPFETVPTNDSNLMFTLDLSYNSPMSDSSGYESASMSSGDSSYTFNSPPLFHSSLPLEPELQPFPCTTLPYETTVQTPIDQSSPAVKADQDNKWDGLVNSQADVSILDDDRVPKQMMSIEHSCMVSRLNMDVNGDGNPIICGNVDVKSRTILVDWMLDVSSSYETYRCSPRSQ